MDAIKIDHKSLGNANVTAITGRLDATTADYVKETLFESIDTGSHKLLLNLNGVDYVSSAGLRTLIQVSRKIEEKEGKLVLFDLTKPVKEILSISGLNGYFNLAESEEEAYNFVSDNQDE